MADEKIEFEVDGADQVARAFENLAKGADKAADSVDKSAKSGSAAAESAKGLAKAAAVAKVAYEALKATFVDSVKIFAEVNAEQGRITRNLDQMGASAREQAQALEELNRKFRDNVKYGASVSEQTKVFRSLLDVTKDRAKAEADLALAIDINADNAMGLEAASKAVQKVRAGDVEILRELGVLSKDEAAALASIKDEAKRTEIALNALNGEFRGAAEENLGLEDKLGETEAQLERMQIAMGELVAEIGEGTAGLVGRLFDMITLSERGTFTFDNFTTGIENFTAAIREAGNETGTFLEGLSEVSLEDLQEKGLFGIYDAAQNARAQRNHREAASNPAVDTGPVYGPEFTTADAVRIQKAKEAEEKAKKKPKKPGKEDDSEQKLWEAQAARLKQARDERELEAKAAEDAAKRKAEAAEKAAERERQAAEKRAADIVASDSAMFAERMSKAEEAHQHSMALQQSRVQGAVEGVEALAGVAAQHSKNQGVQLAAEVLSAGARAAMTWSLVATPPPLGGPQYLPGAIAQTAAVAAAAAKASQLGGGSGGGASAGAARAASAGAGGSARNASSSAPQSRQNLDLFSDRFRQGRQPASAEYHIHTTVTPRPEDARRLFDAMESERRNRS